MSLIIIKPEPDVDLYMVWATGSEGICYVGTRAELIDRVETHNGEPRGDRFDRADRNGTSVFPFATGDRVITGTGAWDHPGLIYQQKGWLPRPKLAEAARLFADGREADIDGLLEPFEDDR